jgi:hypothetical protein
MRYIELGVLTYSVLKTCIVGLRTVLNAAKKVCRERIMFMFRHKSAQQDHNTNVAGKRVHFESATKNEIFLEFL